MTSYTGTSTGFKFGACKPEYVLSILNDAPVTLNVAAGGAGTLRVGDLEFKVQVAPSGISGSAMTATCGMGVNCKYTLDLARFK
jgi:hypothetical protein